MLATVLRHRWKQLVRGASVAGGCLQAVVVLVMGSYLVIAAVVLGAVFPAIAERAAPQTSPAALLNGSMLAGLLALVGAPLWTRLLARLFTARRHRMLAGFRAS